MSYELTYSSVIETKSSSCNNLDGILCCMHDFEKSKLGFLLHKPTDMSKLTYLHSRKKLYKATQGQNMGALVRENEPW